MKYISIYTFGLFVTMVQLLSGQNPAFKLYIDSVESKNNLDLVSSSIRIGNQYYPLLNPERKKIALSDDIDLLKIEAVRFVVNKDTVVFPIERLIEDFDISSIGFKANLLNILFHSTKKWDLRIRHISNDDQIDLVSANNKKTKRKNTSYKIYALQTINWKYYIIKT